MSVDEFIKIMGGLGLGASAGAVATALINTRSNRGKSRAEAADLLMNAAERVGRFNAELDHDLSKVRLIVFTMRALTAQYASNQITREEFLFQANRVLNPPEILNPQVGEQD